MVNKTLQIKLTPNELAREFCEMCSDEQASFLNEVGRIAKDEWRRSMETQVNYIFKDGNLDANGKNFLNIIADYVNEV